MTSMKEHLGEDAEPTGTPNGDPPDKDPRKRLHRATYASDKREGGYNVRIVGPYPEKFTGKTVPVNTKAGGEHLEKLVRLLWTGTDTDSGKKAALYKFEQKPREEEELPF